MPSLNIERSIEISASSDQVYAAINDFNKWMIWSPWLISEPEAQVEIAEDGRSYSWKGNRVGEGNMKIRSEEKGKSIDFDLNFLKPWKSSSSTRFELSDVGEGVTKATWTMDSSLPFFMFWMKKMMAAFVGAEYERGLDMLKSLVESGEVHSKLDFDGFDEYQGCEWIGIKTECTLDEIGPQMERDFSSIGNHIQAHADLASGPVFTIYHKWDMVKNMVSYTAAVPVRNRPADLPSNFTSGTIPACKVYKIRHTGPYMHVGNAWSTGYMMARNKEFKQMKKIDPFEIYLNDPKETPAKELITLLHFPVK